MVARGGVSEASATPGKKVERKPEAPEGRQTLCRPFGAWVNGGCCLPGVALALHPWLHSVAAPRLHTHYERPHFGTASCQPFHIAQTRRLFRPRVRLESRPALPPHSLRGSCVMKDSQGEPNGGISRRGFLTGTGTAAAAVTGLTAELAPSAAGHQPAAVAALGPAPVLLQLTVNGQQVTTNVEPRVTLLDALRNYLDVTGCKRVCDRGTCGACTVMLNGRTVYSCTMLALEARGSRHPHGRVAERGRPARSGARRVLRLRRPAVRLLHARLRRLHPARRSTRTLTPRREEIEAALTGNICRCGTYEQMRVLDRCNFARRGAESWQKAGPKNADFSAHGSSGSTAPPRPPAGRSTATTSTARACCTAAILRSPYAHAKIKSIDTSAARKTPGFKAITIIGVSRDWLVAKWMPRTTRWKSRASPARGKRIRKRSARSR